MDGEKIIHDVAERVRELLAEAEERAAEIVRDAEAEAKRIRERAETEGTSGVAEFRSALEDLQGKLTAPRRCPPSSRRRGRGRPRAGGRTRAGAARPGAGARARPGAATPEPTPEPEPAIVPEPTPPPDEGTPPAAAGRSDDATGARLVAMNMALEGASREEIESHLAESYELDDAGAIVDDVLALAAK